MVKLVGKAGETAKLSIRRARKDVSYFALKSKVALSSPLSRSAASFMYENGQK